MTNFYTKMVLKHFRQPKNYGRLANPTHQASETNSSCGDELTLTFNVRHGIIVDIKFTGEGCALMTATASVLTERIKGKKLSEAAAITEYNVKQLLDGVEVDESRRACLTLPIEALRKALGH